MMNEISAIFSRVRIAQQKFDEARRELDEAVDMFLNYREEQPVQATPILQSEPDLWLTPKQVCRRLNISYSTFFEWVRQGKLPQGIEFSARAKRWRISDIVNWNDDEHNEKIPVKVIVSESVKRRGRPSKIHRREEFI